MGNSNSCRWVLNISSNVADTMLKQCQKYSYLSWQLSQLSALVYNIFTETSNIYLFLILMIIS